MSKGSGEGEGRRKVLGRRGGHISSKKSKGKGGGVGKDGFVDGSIESY